MKDKFAVFILSHGRAEILKRHTLKSLKKHGYTGDWFILLDNEDEQISLYQKMYGKEKCVIFNKEEAAKHIDDGINTGDRTAIVYARNASFDAAKKLGYRYFMELDDDYDQFIYRYVIGGKLRAINIKNLDGVISSYLACYKGIPAKTLCLAQNGDFIGGKDSGNYQKGILRKAMNTFICDTERRFHFVGKSNEDVSTYVTLGNRGELFFTFARAAIQPHQTQSLKGGMSEFYQKGAGYIKPFSSVIYAPAIISVSTMGGAHKRLHHSINWGACSPKILNERYKKENGNRSV